MQLTKLLFYNAVKIQWKSNYIDFNIEITETIDINNRKI